MQRIKERIRRGLRWGVLGLGLGLLALGVAGGENLHGGRLAGSSPGEWPWQLSGQGTPGEFPWQLSGQGTPGEFPWQVSAAPSTPGEFPWQL